MSEIDEFKYQLSRQVAASGFSQPKDEVSVHWWYNERLIWTRSNDLGMMFSFDRGYAQLNLYGECWKRKQDGVSKLVRITFLGSSNKKLYTHVQSSDQTWYMTEGDFRQHVLRPGEGDLFVLVVKALRPRRTISPA